MAHGQSRRASCWPPDRRSGYASLQPDAIQQSGRSVRLFSQLPQGRQRVVIQHRRANRFSAGTAGCAHGSYPRSRAIRMSSPPKNSPVIHPLQQAGTAQHGTDAPKRTTTPCEATSRSRPRSTTLSPKRSTIFPRYAGPRHRGVRRCLVHFRLTSGRYSPIRAYAAGAVYQSDKQPEG